MRFRLRALLLSSTSILVAAVLLAVLLAVFAPIGGLIYNHREFPKRLKVGREIVAAVNEFKQQNSRWPSRLDELVPTFLPELPPTKHRWAIVGSGNTPPYLRGYAGMHHSVLLLSTRKPPILYGQKNRSWLGSGR